MRLEGKDLAVSLRFAHIFIGDDGAASGHGASRDYTGAHSGQVNAGCQVRSAVGSVQQ